MEYRQESYLSYIYTNIQSWHCSHYIQYHKSSTRYFLKRRIMMIDHKYINNKKIKVVSWLNDRKPRV